MSPIEHRGKICEPFILYLSAPISFVSMRICADPFETSTSLVPRKFELLKIGMFTFPPPRTKKSFKASRLNALPLSAPRRLNSGGVMFKARIA